MMNVPRFCRSVAIVALATAACSLYAEPVQQLANADFKKGMEGWDTPQGDVTVTQENGPDGGNVVKMVGAANSATLASAYFAVTPKIEYLAVAWLRSVDTGMGTIKIKFYDKDKKPIDGAEKENGIGDQEDDWQSVQVRLNAPAGAAYGKLIISGGASGQGRLEFSDPKVLAETPQM